MSLFNLPGGVYDVLPEESYNLEQVKNSLRLCFTRSGCEFIETPGIEYFDNFTAVKGRILQEKMFKMTDSDGRLLVVRPDVTLSAARIAATKLENDINKLCYFSNVYEADAKGVNLREISQAGVEFMGVKSDFADAECIALAIESLKAAGIKDFIIDIGHTGFFKGLLSESGLNDAETESVRRYVNRKDLLSAERILNSRNTGKAALEAIMALPSLFGGVEAIEKAAKLTDNEEAKKSLESLRLVYKMLCDFGYENYISVDLGAIKSLSYYTGIVFTGMCSNLGSPILTGGRYDDLAAEFGKQIPAVGFAIGLKRLIVLLEREGRLIKRPAADVLIAAYEGAEKEAYDFAQKARRSGINAYIYNSFPDGAQAFAQLKGIQSVKIFGKNKND